MMFLRTVLVSSLLIWSQVGFSDIFDRINRCEDRDGANGCVYDLLRELAREGGGGGDPDECFGTEYSGACWFVGDTGQSCQDVCEIQGLTFNPRTSIGGSNAQCLALGQALNMTGNGRVNGGPTCSPDTLNGTGCGFWPNGAASLYWCGRRATAEAAHSAVQRFCACR